jgi:2-polyprenyl-3-methyl-5-hydroxy-6-metoxy-1,4-benzoquinol methylase
MLDDAYTQQDHEYREDDPYANAKYQITLRWLQTAAPPSNRALSNVGCGGGVFSDLAHAAGYKVSAFEPDPEAFALAAARAGSNYPVKNVGLFEVGDLTLADVAVMHDVLEHIDAEAAAVTALANLVKKDGLVVVSVPALTCLFGLHDEQLGHFRRYSKKALRRSLERDFHVIKIRYVGFTLIPVAFWFSRFRRKSYPTAQVSGGIVGRLLRTVIAVEARVPLPLGTSVLALAKKK